MPTLAIDTATDFCAIAVGGADGLIAGTQFEAGRSHLELLLPRLQLLLDDNSIGRSDLDGIVAGTGPGTFSGLRVGIATARGLAQALAIPLTGFSTLRGLAMGMHDRLLRGDILIADDTALDIMPVIDARRGQVFAQLFRATGEGLNEISGIICLSPESLIERVQQMSVKKVLAAGNGVLADDAVFSAASQLRIPEPDNACHLVDAGFHLQAVSMEPADLRNIIKVTPVYGREPDADSTVLSRKRESWLS